jgi:hypothetical protein
MTIFIPTALVFITGLLFFAGGVWYGHHQAITQFRHHNRIQQATQNHPTAPPRPGQRINLPPDGTEWLGQP